MIYVHGFGHFHPENVITNKFLEDLDIGTTEEWILDRVGIESRRTVLPLDYIRETKNADPELGYKVRLYSNARGGAEAARMAIARAGITPQDIGLVISGSSIPEYLVPSEASTVAGELGIDVPCFDLNAACTTYGMQINFLDMMKPEKLPPYILILNIELTTLGVDFSDRASAVLFGDAASATVVSASVPSQMTFTDCHVFGKPTQWDKIIVPKLGYFSQDGNAVQKFAIVKMTDSLRAVQASHAGSCARFLFVGHQANFGVLKTTCERTDIREDAHWHNVTQFGNTGCAGAVVVLSQHWEDLQAGDCVAVVLVGGGLSWTRMVLNVNEKGSQ
jgi:3-oxoacyl-[acyl-carrier-protein] synthase III